MLVPCCSGCCVCSCCSCVQWHLFVGSYVLLMLRMLRCLRHLGERGG